MLYTKEIEKITFQDVIEFCNQQYRENINLDYKQELNSNVAKTIAAMANTWGGLIIIGVEEEDSKPKLPVRGIEYKEHLREQVNNIILGNIMPPIFPEIQVCTSKDSKRAFIVIRVPQSNLTPHAIKNNTKVYIRTDTSNEPEELASVDRILWFIDRRKKSEMLKNGFYERAEARFNTLCKREGVIIERTDAIFSICPLYPFEALIDYKKLHQDIPNKIRTSGWGYTFPLYLMRQSEFLPTQYGAYGFFVNDRSKYVLYEEINHYGLFYHREDLAHASKNNEEKIVYNSLLWEVLTRTDMFLETVLKLYNELGYWGLLDLRISFNKLHGVTFKDLPAPRGYIKFDDIESYPIDQYLEFKKIISYKELKNDRIILLIDLVKEISWAIGFSHIKPETIRRLLEENGRI